MDILPDLDLISDPNLELYFMQRADHIKRINNSLNMKGVLCKKSFAIVLGVYHDKRKCEHLYRKLNRLKCLQKAGIGFRFIIEKFEINDDSDIIASDPFLSLLDKIVTDQDGINNLIESEQEEETLEEE